MASEDPTAAAPVADEEPLFDPSLKKKKKGKKSVGFSELDGGGAPGEDNVEEDDAAPAPAAASDDKGDDKAEATTDDLFGGMKKKSKKKKAIPMDLDMDDNKPMPPSGAAEAGEPASEAGASAADAVPDGDLDFTQMKKKKKSKKAAFDLEAFEKELGEDSGVREKQEADDDGEAADVGGEDEGDLGDDPFAADDVAEGQGESKEEAAETWHDSDRDYTYQELLGRVFKILRQNNPALSDGRKKYTIVPPSVHRDGSKKTVFANVVDICKRMHRQPDHVIQFLFSELGTMGSVDGSQRLVIKGRFQPKQIENVLRRYIVEYVTCKTCKSPNTLLTKENRIYFMTCESCGSQRSVSAIKTGFQAQTGRRKRV